MSLSILTPPQEEIIRFLRNGAKLLRVRIPPLYGFQFGNHLRGVSVTSVRALLKGGWIEEYDREGQKAKYRLTAAGLAEATIKKPHNTAA